jgi:EpsI family protein
MLSRSMIVALVLACASWIVRQPPAAATGLARPLSSVPHAIGTWSGEDVPLDAETLRALGMDDYLHRVYVPRDGAATSPVGVYVAYYASQRQGDAIHSPLNCLPGNGWQPVSRERVRMQSRASGAFTANRLVVQKGRERQDVLYWYDGRGRRLASEYMNKLLLIVDGVRENRTEAALVRLTTPVDTTVAAAGDRLEAFATEIDPVLVRALAPATQGQRP